MEIKKSNIKAYILAGGKSSRMGVDKGLMMMEGKAMVYYVIEQFKDAVADIVIVSNNPDYAGFGYEVIPDLILDIGPAGGIYSALHHANTEKVFIVSCDMPYIDANAINLMLENNSKEQIILPVFKGELEPLFGLYAKDCLLVWAELIRKDIIKLKNMVVHFKLKRVFFDEKDSAFNDQLFLNINTKSDFDHALNLQRDAN